MQALCIPLSLLHIIFYITIEVSAEATILNTEDVDYDNIDNVIMEGNQTKYAAIVILKPNNKNSDPDDQPIDDTNFKAVDTYSGNLNDDYEDRDDERNPTNEDSDELTVLPLGALRKKPWKSCLKRASKICTKACKVSYKEACSYRGCEKKLKKSLKRECKRQCKSFFLDY